MPDKLPTASESGVGLSALLGVGRVVWCRRRSDDVTMAAEKGCSLWRTTCGGIVGEEAEFLERYEILAELSGYAKLPQSDDERKRIQQAFADIVAVAESAME